MHTTQCTYYDDPEFDYQDYWQGRDYENLAERAVLQTFYSHVGHQRLLLDIGGGYGRLINEYLPFADQILLIEPAQKLATAAATNAPKSVTVIQATAQTLCLQPQTADLIQMVRVAHHCLDLKAVIKKISTTLKPGGWLILEFPNKIHGLMTLKHWWSGDWQFRINLNSLDRRTRHVTSTHCIPFMNHHPRQILTWLRQNNLSVIRCYSVSNLRRVHILPLSWLLTLDRWLWQIAQKIWWGPSIFILARKSYQLPTLPPTNSAG